LNEIRLSMNRLEKILITQRINTQIEATSKKRVFELAGLLFEEINNLSRALVTESLLSRERLGSTGLGHGVAVPHGRIKGLKTPMAAVIQLKDPVPFSAPDDEPVSLFYCLLVPEAATQEHLDILSQIMEIMRNENVRNKLLKLTDVHEIHQLLTKIPKFSESKAD
jgi:nitrogen PTS system EIIA component